jgi:Tfp pilus assembly protein PilE
MDLQSVMVGVVVSAIIAGVAMASVVGMTRMVAVDTGKTNLSILTNALESFYTENDRYPTNITELTDANFVPRTYANNPNICYKSDPSTAGSYPQKYEAGTFVKSTNDLFYANQDKRKATLEEGTNKHCFV